MELDEGEFRFQIAQILTDDELDDEVIQRMIQTTLAMLDRYLPAGAGGDLRKRTAERRGCATPRAGSDRIPAPKTPATTRRCRERTLSPFRP